MSFNNLCRTHEYEIWMYPISHSDIKRKYLQEHQALYRLYYNDPDSIETTKLYQYVEIQQFAPVPKSIPSYREQRLLKIRLQRMLYDIITS